MTRREIAGWLALIITAGIIGVLIGLAITRELDRHMDRSRPETPIINQSQMGAQ